MRRLNGMWWFLGGCLGALILAPWAGAQGFQQLRPIDPSYMVGGNYAAAEPQTANADELAQRVADLEKALGEMKAKEADAKKKAAEKYSVTVDGRVFVDSVFFGQSAGSVAAFGDAQDTVQFRTARLGAQGSGFDVFDYKIEVDFAGRDSTNDQSTSFKDVYLGINDLPFLGRVQIGHFKEPFSIEELTSSRYITFMERSLLNVFAPQRNVGVAAYRVSENERFTFAFGGFRTIGDKPPYVADDDGGYAFTMRGTYLPWYDEATNGRGLLHLGLGYSYRDVDDPNQRIRARAETNVGPYILDTGVITGVEDFQLLDPEIAFVYGPFSVQAEYIAAFYNRAGNDADFHAAYVQMSYFLTGEHRPYDRKKGAFSRVKPFENFFRVRTCDGNIEMGKGAWELAYRYSWLDLDDADAGVFGGNSSDHTVGVNWYLNPYTRLMFNYVYAQVSPANNNPDSDLSVFQMRAQFDF
ncbi:OprO/OprP family phosphate-selective porin [Thermopirellula anaerolimosa]